MTLSLHAATVPGFLQAIGATLGLLDKAEAFCAEHGRDPAALVAARLAPDMAPFAYQIRSVASHSIGAIEGVRAGRFAPDMTPPPADFAGLRARLVAARDALAAIDPGELDGYIGRDMEFAMKDFRIPFTAENFLLSFSLPNFYFHATTAYDILRAEGLPIGKRDFLGAMRVKG